MLIAAATNATTTPAGGGSGGSTFFLFIILGLAAMWLIVIRPQRRKQKVQQTMQSDLSVGDEILTAGGLYGKVTRIDDDEARVEIAPNVEVRLALRAIAARLSENEPADTAAAPESDDASDERWQSAFDAESGEEKSS